MELCRRASPSGGYRKKYRLIFICESGGAKKKSGEGQLHGDLEDNGMRTSTL